MIRKMVSHETAEYSSVVFDAIQSIEIEEKEQSSIEWPPPLSRSIWLVFSSCFFLVPGLYAFINSCFFIGLVSSLTTLMSVAHWVKAESGLRQKIDRCTASVSFVIYFMAGILFLRGLLLFAVGLPGVILMLSCFYMSHKMLAIGSSKWIYFHFCFHVFVALEQLLVVYAMVHSGVVF